MELAKTTERHSMSTTFASNTSKCNAAFKVVHSGIKEDEFALIVIFAGTEIEKFKLSESVQRIDALDLLIKPFLHKSIRCDLEFYHVKLDKKYCVLQCQE